MNYVPICQVYFSDFKKCNMNFMHAESDVIVLVYLLILFNDRY